MRPSRILLALCLTLLPARLAAEWIRIGPDGGDIAALAAAPSRPAVLYAAVESGNVLRSLDRGQTWTRAGWTNTRLSDIAVDPRNPSLLYAVGLRGVLRSADGGASWKQVRRGNALYRITGVAVHPRTGTVFAFGAQHLLRSTDRGLTWMSRRPWPQYVQTLAFDPARPGVLFAGTRDEGLFRSANGGETWQPASQGLPEEGGISALAVDPRSPDTVWAGLAGRQGGVFKSIDGGATWTPSLNGLGSRSIQDLAVDPQSSSVLYAIAEGRLFRSANGGADWTAADSGPAAQLKDLEPAPFGLLAATQAGVSLSTDKGLTWRARQHGLTGLHIASLAIDTQSPPRLYAGTLQAGLFKTLDRGGSWRPLAPLDTPLVFERPLEIAPDDPETVYTTAGLSVVRSTNGGLRWEPYGSPVCAAPTALAVDPRDPATVYTSGILFSSGCGQLPQTCRFARIDAAGESVCLAGNLLYPDWVTLLGVDHFTSAVYVHNLDGISRSDDRGATWSHLVTVPNLVSFAASPRVEGTLYATQMGVVWRSRDGGQTWRQFTAGLPADAWFVGMAFDPVDPDILYAGILKDGVFRSTDGGETWSPVGTWFKRWTLRAGPVLDPADPSVLYVGTEEASVLRYEPDGE